MAEDATTQEQSETPVTHAIPVDQPPQVQEQQQSEPLPVQPSVDSPVPPLTNIHADIDMADFGPTPTVPPAAVTPTPQRIATPSRNTNGNVEAPAPLPARAAIHGAPARRYLNEKVTGVLLEGMKRLAVEQYVLSLISSHDRSAHGPPQARRSAQGTG
ncbi:MAG: hypothetical protein LQ343_003154 [Gyalolechia ehrenbergii]|nr:MAG: hypothetical protein LQ343_003154 [Gyalolechia ehrenbergii]